MKTHNAKMTIAAISAVLGFMTNVFADQEITSSTTWNEGRTISDTLTVSGQETTLTLGSGQAITVVAGQGKVVVKEGASVSAPDSASDDSFVVGKESETIEAGVVDVLELNAAKSITLDFKNEATATGRVSVAGGVIQFDRRGGWKYDNATFVGNPWLIDVAKESTAYFYHGGQGGHFNDAGTDVMLTGEGNVRFGQAYSKDSGGAFAIKKGAQLCNTGTLEFWGFYGDQTSGVFEFCEGAKVDGPSSLVISSDSEKGPIILQLDAGVDFTVRNVDFVREGIADQICGTGSVIKIDASAADVTFAANIPSVCWDDATQANTLTFEKSGANNATLAVTNIPALVVSEGTVTLTKDCVIGSLTTATDTKVVVDGATLYYSSSSGSVGIELKNGAKAFRVVTGTEGEESGMDRSGLKSETTLLKTGDTDLIVYDPSSIAGLVHVKGGALRFSKRGLSDKYIRLTVKECYPFKDYEGEHYSGLWLKVGLYSAADAFVNADYCGSADAGTAPSALSENHFAVPEGTLFTGTDASVGAAFSISNGDIGNGYGVPCFTNVTKTLCKDASDENGWQRIWGRLKSEQSAIDGINFASGWAWGIVKAWTFETSKTGEDGSWQVVQEITAAPNNTGSENNCGILSGDANKPAAHFRYIEPGVTGLADTLQIQVDEGATLDFGAKTGGQTINRVLVDATAGVVTNVVFASSGVIELVGANTRETQGLLPLVFEGVSGVENLSNWTVECAGQACHRRARFSAADKKIELLPPGMLVIVR